jgi:hypothetical protein
VVLDGAGCVGEGETREAPRGSIVQPVQESWRDRRQAAVGLLV